jgi:hypothetical protein
MGVEEKMRKRRDGERGIRHEQCGGYQVIRS